MVSTPASAAPIVGGMGASTRLMVITTTSAAALAAGSGISGLQEEDRADALILLTLLAGGFMIVAGLFKLGRYTRFVSHSVMLGFLSGVAVNIVLGQLADLTGGHGEGGTAIARAFDLLRNPSELDLASTLVGVGALALLAGLARTPLAIVSTLVALVVPTAVVLLAGLDSVAQVDDTGAIPSGVPLPGLPDLSQFSVSLLAAAAAVAAIVLVQGAGVAESAPNDDGPSNANRDFVAQGAANVAVAALRGMPVGASVGQTALNTASGARTRWGSIWTGIWMLVILAAFSGVVGKVAMPTLAAILIFAAFGALRPREVLAVAERGTEPEDRGLRYLHRHPPAAGARGSWCRRGHFVVPPAQPGGDRPSGGSAGRGRRWSSGRVPPPARLTSHTTTVLDVYGSLFYAGSRTLQSLLPDPMGSEHPAVLLRLRGRTTLGATFFSVISGYAGRLEAAGGRLYLTGVDPALAARLRAVGGQSALTGSARLYEATPVLGESTRHAMADAATLAVARAPAASEPGSEPIGPA